MVEVSVFISPTSNTKLNLSSLFIEPPTNKRIAYFTYHFTTIKPYSLTICQLK